MSLLVLQPEMGLCFPPIHATSPIQSSNNPNNISFEVITTQVITLNVHVTSFPFNYLSSGSLCKPIEWVTRVDVLFVVIAHCTFIYSPFSIYFYSTPRSLLPPPYFNSSSLPSHPLLLFILIRIIFTIIIYVLYISFYFFLLILPPTVPSLQSATNYYLSIVSF